MIEKLSRLLISVGWGLGALVIIAGIWRYWKERSVPALLIALAVLVAGPLEDVLKGWVRRRRLLRQEEPAITLIDVATSVAFLALLLWVIFLIP